MSKQKKANGEGSIWSTMRNGKPYYRGTVTLGIDEYGKPIRKTVCSRQKSKVIEGMNALRREVAPCINNRNITLGELFRMWIFDYKKNEVQNNTFAEYEVCYRLRIEPYSISKVRLSELKLEALQRYFNALSEHWSNNVVKKTLTKVSSCLNFATVNGYIPRNLCKAVTIAKPVVKKDDKYKVFTREEQEKILGALDLRNVIDQIIYLDFYTGLRIAEILALKWEHIEGNMLKVRQQFQKDIKIDKDGSRKTTHIIKDVLKTSNSEREIILPSKALEMLEGAYKMSDYIFVDHEGKLIDDKRPRRKLKKICRDLGINDNRTFHSIRHTYATRLFEINVPLKTVQVLLGHRDIQTTMNVYTHVTKVKKLEALEMLETL